MISLQEIMVHLFSGESRDEVMLEHKWRNPAPDEQVYEKEKNYLRSKMKNKKSSFFKPFEDD